MIPGGPDKPLQILLPERLNSSLDLFFSLTVLMQTYFFLVLGYFLMEAVTEGIVFWDNEEKPRASASTNGINSTDWCIP